MMEMHLLQHMPNPIEWDTDNTLVSTWMWWCFQNVPRNCKASEREGLFQRALRCKPCHFVVFHISYESRYIIRIIVHQWIKHIKQFGCEKPALRRCQFDLFVVLLNFVTSENTLREKNQFIWYRTLKLKQHIWGQYTIDKYYNTVA